MAGHSEAKTTKLEHAAQEFESLLLAQLLKTAREAGSGDWLGSGKSQGANPALELAETQLARVMAQGGALGLTRLLVSGLSESPSGARPSNKAGPSRGSAMESSTRLPARRED